ncbi:MAG TPA: hypothetical protein VMU83_18280 [Hanamia sp.]|nr:hypothetical protein [Hanamia sp.]
MDFQDVEAKFDIWKYNLSTDEKKYIHYNSMKIFLYHYNNINDRKKKIVLSLFENYILEVEDANFSFSKDESLGLANKYINKLADIYTGLGFKLNIKLSFVFWWGILADILLLIIGILPKIRYIPIITISLLLYYLYLQIFKKPSKLVYGIFY